MPKSLGSGHSLVPVMKARALVDQVSTAGQLPVNRNESQLAPSSGTRQEDYVFDSKENYRILLALLVGSVLTWIAVGSKAELAWVIVVGFGVGHLSGAYSMFYLLKHGINLWLTAKVLLFKLKTLFKRSA